MSPQRNRRPWWLLGLLPVVAVVGVSLAAQPGQQWGGPSQGQVPQPSITFDFILENVDGDPNQPGHQSMLNVEPKGRQTRTFFYDGRFYTVTVGGD